MILNPEEQKAYQEYLDDFDPTPQYYGEDYSSPLSEDSWLEEYLEEEELKAKENLTQTL